jgi:hypothetical protein
MSNKMYDILSKCQRFLPSLGLFYLGLCKIWGFPYGNEVNQTIVLLATLLGTILEIATAQYLKSIKKTSESFSDQNHIEG